MNAVQGRWAACAARQAPGWQPCMKHNSLGASHTCAALAPHQHQVVSSGFCKELKLILYRERLVLESLFKYP